MHRFLVVQLFVVLSFSGLSCSRRGGQQTEKTVVTKPVMAPIPKLRLPSGVVPLRVRAELAIRPRNPVFHGTIEIDVRLDQPTSSFWLNARGLDIDAASVLPSRSGRSESSTAKSNDSTSRGEALDATVRYGGDDFVELKTDSVIDASRATLVLRYRGHQEDEKTEGLYRVKESDGVWYTYTMFEPIMARRVFPSFDEPGFKIPWTLSLRIDKADVAATNTPQVGELEHSDGTKTLTFAETKPLPSYLIAFMVGPFDMVDAGVVAKAKVPLRFIVPPGHQDELDYAKQVTPRIVEILENMIGIPYPFAKLDVAVVPRFWGTMEHPGIVALGQPLTLNKPADDTRARRMRYANIAIHELCHYWYGDLVTMKWWNDVWLNEAFGTWCDAKATQILEPGWGYDLIAVDRARGAFRADRSDSVKRISEPAESQENIESSFTGSVTYFKGAAVIRMFEKWVGDDLFRDLIKRYLNKYAWKNATSESLVEVLDAGVAKGKPNLGQALLSFVKQAGAPQITMALSCKQGKTHLDLSQRRFAPLGSAIDAKTARTSRWMVPVCVRYGTRRSAHRECFFLESEHQRFELSNGEVCPTWFVGNSDGAGYYRSAYDKSTHERVSEAFRTQASASEIIAIAGDLMAAVDAGTSDLQAAFALLPALSTSKSSSVVSMAVSLLGGVDDMITAKQRDAYARLIRHTFGAKARQLGWKAKRGESTDDSELRTSLLLLVGVRGKDRVIRKEAERRTRKYLRNPDSIAPETSSVALLIAAHYGDKALFESMLEAAHKASDASKRSRLLTPLGNFNDPDLVERAFAIVLSDEFDLRDTRGIIPAAASRKSNHQRLWNFITEHFDELAKRMTRTYLKYFLVSPSRLFCNQEGLDMAKAFYDKKLVDYPGTELRLRNQLDQIRLCIAYRKRHQAGVAKLFEASK